MTTAKEYSDNAQREVNIDVDALLEAIQAKIAGDVRDAIAPEQPHRLTVEGKRVKTYTELADAFELDIRDYAISEVNH
ncbi:MAG: DUF2525 domain-containing protein [Enterobacterales bacterium endosymbiont of Blomia tropicalis]|uniref:DUF2525 domain-containing protein n=1 Tax=Mixta mediterraneensis TaxID=2758443 RepID=UPI0018742A06|nr:DUF2525 domain-containing protein [Mixta mediterraneensis]MBE5251411.1 DUF2525 domain-containing protein [Mixta mediterraneensis]MDL4913842.1 DUF2525 domain-containing protein [Mixta mediterraneensis]